MRVKLNQPVNTGPDYGITTCAELLDQNHAFVEISETEQHRTGKTITRYLVVLLDLQGVPTEYAFEIGQKAYESRVAKGQNIAPVVVPESAVAPVLALFDGITLSAPEYLFTTTPTWHEESQSFVFDLPAYALTSDLRACLRRSFAVCEIESAHYGETFVVSFFGTLTNSEIA